MIEIKDVEHVAKLARLALSEEEKQKFAKQLNSILEYMNELNEVDTSGIAPMEHSIKITNVMREDTVVVDFSREELLKNAPEEEDGFFRVPKIN
ncbi:MAG: Asp-tRNA(Asn)/Glu-tRNA(Gln) amidotransferase subunit GatC [Candidatus Gastranaerophilales bacterium]|nr:Asp-tRNA(Asn)/Glu-tRNA(Gln) amidotransferase subunit GatC [Candidatus Gastranaerophilales bacterium]